MNRWQQIDTAYRDGTEFIGLYWDEAFERKGDIVKCWFQPEFDAFISSCQMTMLAEGYRYSDGSRTRLHSPVIEKISHWMPLPLWPSATDVPRQKGASE